MTQPDDRPITVILDRSALLAYAAGSMHVSETINQAVENGTRCGVPVPAAVEALAVVPGGERDALDWLLTEPDCAVLDTWGDDWAALAYWRDLTGRYDTAAAVVAVIAHDAVILTSDAKAYRADRRLPVIVFPA